MSPDITPGLELHTHEDWKTQLSQSISSIPELLTRVGVQVEDLSHNQQAARDFPLKVPAPFVSRIRFGDPKDPLLTQVLPCVRELKSEYKYNSDPLKELEHNSIRGIIHKYRRRVLLIVSSNCAINCRYCFRRHFPYEDNRQGKRQWQQVIDYITGREEIHEVVYSGGDPLAANDQFLAWLTEQISAISHVRRLRIHTRLPVVIPSRVDNRLLSWLGNTRFKPVMVLHINHAQEIDQSLKTAIQKLLDADIKVLNQSVLLRGVNDNVSALFDLSDKLFECGVLPYYLHLLDPVAGASHFDISEEKALSLYRQLQAELPGYLVPKLVRDEPGENSKTLRGSD